MSPGKAAGRERRSAAIRDALHAFSLEQACTLPSYHPVSNTVLPTPLSTSCISHAPPVHLSCISHVSPTHLISSQAADPSVNQLLLPLRDGLTWVQPAPTIASPEAGAAAAAGEPLAEAAPLPPSSLARYLAAVGSDEPSPMRSLRTTAAEEGEAAGEGEAAEGEAPGAASAPLRGRLLQMEP